MAHHPGPRRGMPAAPAGRCPRAASAFFTSERSSSRIFGMSIFTGQTSAHAPHRLEANGRRRLVIHAQKLRRDDGADRPGIDPRKTVAADLAIHRAVIQARAAADAVERLALLAIRQQLGAAVVEQHHVELIRPVDLLAAPRPGEKRSVDRERLAGGAAAQQLQKHGQILRARNQLLDARHGDVNLRRRSGQPRVAFVFDQHHRARIGHQKIRAADADIGRQKFLAQHGARDHGLLLDDGFVAARPASR